MIRQCLMFWLLLGLFRLSTWADTIKIMPLGDSITKGVSDLRSYRPYLYAMLTDSGHAVDFVGSLQNPSTANPDFDPDHEGHFGWRADQILDKAATYAQAKPDIVLCHLGTNDLANEQGSALEKAQRTASDIEAIIAVFRSANPSTRFFLAKIILGRVPSVDSSILAFHKELDSVAQKLTTAQSPIEVVDQSDGFDVNADLGDNWHPNQAGAQKMAHTWFEVLHPTLSLSTRVAADFMREQKVQHVKCPALGNSQIRRVDLLGRIQMNKPSAVGLHIYSTKSANALKLRY